MCIVLVIIVSLVLTGHPPTTIAAVIVAIFIIILRARRCRGKWRKIFVVIHFFLLSRVSVLLRQNPSVVGVCRVRIEIIVISFGCSCFLTAVDCCVCTGEAAAIVVTTTTTTTWPLCCIILMVVAVMVLAVVMVVVVVARWRTILFFIIWGLEIILNMQIPRVFLWHICFN